MSDIKISSGIKTYNLVDENGKQLGQISFNPSDTDIVKRYKEVMKQLNKMNSTFIKNIDKKTTAERLKELDAVIYEKIDYLLNAEVSETFFAIMGPFSPLARGQFFFEHVLEVVGHIIESENEERTKKLSDKVNKYTAKYHG